MAAQYTGGTLTKQQYSDLEQIWLWKLASDSSITIGDTNHGAKYI